MKGKRIITLSLAVIVGLSMNGCKNQSVGSADVGFELSHFDGSDTTNGYDTDLLYQNTSEFLGGDTGIIWVSEEEDPEYGGYFYQYMGDAAGVGNRGVMSTEDGKTASVDSEKQAAYHSHVTITRSKDLNDWEVCGAVDNGMGLKVGVNSWFTGMLWAPETIRDPESGKYFMYFGAVTRSDDIEGAEYAQPTAETPFIQYGGVAVSDTPIGPFEIVTSENYYGSATAVNPNGEILTDINPTFMFEKYYGKDNTTFPGYWADPNPYYDDKGNLYLSFTATGITGYTLAAVRMKDMVTPDYSTISFLTMGVQDGPSYVRVLYKGDTSKHDEITPGYGVNLEYCNDANYPRYNIESWDFLTTWEDGTENVRYLEDGTENPDFNGFIGQGLASVREGQQIISHKDSNGKTTYYLTNTFTGVQSPQYDVHWASSDSPLGPFTYPKNRELGVVLGLDVNNDFMTNLGHVQFLEVGGEWWIAHWEWPEPFGTIDIGRIYALSQMTWIEDDRVDCPVPVANGPTKSLQALPSVTTGYRNIASEAKIEATNVKKDSLQYLTDGYVVTKHMYADREFKAEESTTITITFDSPRTIRGILLHNSYTYKNAFAGISAIRFTLAETPSWRNGTEKACFIRDLGFNEEYYNAKEAWIQAGAAAVATFDEITVTKIEIDIDNMLGDSDELRISELKVMGK